MVASGPGDQCVERGPELWSQESMRAAGEAAAEPLEILLGDLGEQEGSSRMGEQGGKGAEEWTFSPCFPTPTKLGSSIR